MKSVYIIGTGVWLPEKVVFNDAWSAEFLQRFTQGERIFNDIPLTQDQTIASQVEAHLRREATDPFLAAVKRHVADATDTAWGTSTEAARAAIAAAKVSLSDIDLVIAHDMIPEKVLPRSASYVADALGINNALCTDVDNACATSLVQLQMAKAFIETGVAKTALLVQSHLMLRAMSMDHPASPGLGDVATAMVVSAEPSSTSLEIRSIYSRTHGEYADSVVLCRDREPSKDTPWWKAGSNFYLGSHNPAQVKELMRETVAFGVRTVQQAIELAGISADDVDVLASVQPRHFIPGAIAQNLGSHVQAVETFKDVAHVGVCGPVYNLHTALHNGWVRPGSHVALYGQGAGFTRAASILRAG